MVDTQTGSAQQQGLTAAGLPNVQQYGVPTVDQYMNRPQEERHNTVREIYRDLVEQGMHPKDAAKQAQAQTGHSVVTGRPIERRPKFSKKTGKVVGQYGTSSGKASSGRFGIYGR